MEVNVIRSGERSGPATRCYNLKSLGKNSELTTSYARALSHQMSPTNDDSGGHREPWVQHDETYNVLDIHHLVENVKMPLSLLGQVYNREKGNP